MAIADLAFANDILVRQIVRSDVVTGTSAVARANQTRQRFYAQQKRERIYRQLTPGVKAQLPARNYFNMFA